MYQCKKNCFHYSPVLISKSNVKPFTKFLDGSSPRSLRILFMPIWQLIWPNLNTLISIFIDIHILAHILSTVCRQFLIKTTVDFKACQARHEHRTHEQKSDKAGESCHRNW